MENPKKKLLFTAGYILLVLILVRLFQNFVLPLFANAFVGNLVYQIIFTALAVTGAVLFGQTKELKLRGKGLREGCMTGLLFLVVYPVMLVLALITGRAVVTETAGNIVLFAIQMVLVGVSEEVLFRAVLQNTALEVTGKDSIADARKGILLAGLVFGLLHLTNILAGVTVVGAVVQAAMAIPLGVVFGIIYFRGCNNLLPVILIHAVIDSVSFIGSDALSGTALNDAISGLGTNSGPLGKIASVLFYAALAAFLMRKSKMEKAIEQHRAAKG